MDKIDHVPGGKPLHTKLGSVASTHSYDQDKSGWHHVIFLYI